MSSENDSETPRIPERPRRSEGEQQHTAVPDVPSNRPLRHHTTGFLKQVPQVPQKRPTRRHTEQLDVAVQEANSQLDQLRTFIKEKPDTKVKTAKTPFGSHEDSKENDFAVTGPDLCYSIDSREKSKESEASPQRSHIMFNSSDERIQSPNFDNSGKSLRATNEEPVNQATMGKQDTETLIEALEPGNKTQESPRLSQSSELCATGRPLDSSKANYGNAVVDKQAECPEIEPSISARQESDIQGLSATIKHALKPAVDVGENLKDISPTENTAITGTEVPQLTEKKCETSVEIEKDDVCLPQAEVAPMSASSSAEDPDSAEQDEKVKQPSSEHDAFGIPERPTKKAPPKKPSSKIAAFQEMLRKQQLQDQDQSGSKGNQPAAGNSSLNEKRAKITSNLNGIFGLPGMVPGSHSNSQPPTRSDETENHISSLRNSSLRDRKEVEVPQRRAKGPRGRKLPAHLVDMEKVEACGTSNEAQVFKAWSIQFIKTDGANTNEKNKADEAKMGVNTLGEELTGGKDAVSKKELLE
ncbi:LANO_0H19768g1_1 [Lachancea nothofagi CBS 11611]|uniref:LANO_0H19768g1_1 n=1 Tax=Lachancea nothofagi CBS 11611 TaxID=1266666 RepID=A0A1G4KN68_9SACH|nr:LANO_0H19768g1_1 [Lachancea nothofagi CBS 11611]